MGRAQALRFALSVVLVIQLNLINSQAQALARVLTNGPNLETTLKEVERSTDTATTASLEESRISVEAPWVPVPSALSSRDPKKLGLVDRAYLDAFTILNEDNECSRLFGGRYAIAALNAFVSQLKPRYLERNVAIRMSGYSTTVQSHKTGFTFRLFDKAEINLAGSFFRTEHASVVSNFPPNTREARAVVLLHELGHIVKSPDEGWLLPDDGTSQTLSLQNTERVLSACRKQINSLGKLTAEEELKLAVKE